MRRRAAPAARLLAAAACLLACAAPISAQGLSGTVSGVFRVALAGAATNYFDPSVSRGVPATGWGNSPDSPSAGPYNVPIRPYAPGGVAFGKQYPSGTFAYLGWGNRVIVNIEGSLLTFSLDTPFGSWGPLQFSFTFSDVLSGAKLMSSTVPGGFSWSTAASSLSLDLPDWSGTADTYTAVFKLETVSPCANAPLPKPVLNAKGWDPSCVANATIGTACRADCNPNYRSLPAPTVSCTAAGTWSAPSNQACARACESNPPPLVNGNWNCAAGGWGTPVRGRCVGACAPGFNGRPFRDCAQAGWTPQIGSCIEGPACVGLPSATIVNGEWPISCYDAAVGSTCVANCKQGYTATTASVTCIANGGVASGAAWATTVAGKCSRT